MTKCPPSLRYSQEHQGPVGTDDPGGLPDPLTCSEELELWHNLGRVVWEGDLRLTRVNLG